MSKLPKLIFFGSGPVAAASLAGLLNDFTVEAVVTKPKAKTYKGAAPVIELARKQDLPIQLATNKEELLSVFKKNSFSSTVGLVVDYGVLIPQKVIDYFPKGIVNSHFSLLPQWRGADPITFALLSRQPRTGVSLMLIEPTLDTGKLLAQAPYDIAKSENIHSLTDNLIELSTQVIKEILPLYLDDKVEAAPQDIEQEPTYSRRLVKADGFIDWKKPAVQIEREVRAFLGWPKSQAKINNQPVIITKVRLATDKNDGDLVMQCSPGWLEILELIGPSGRRMSGADFIRGYGR